MFFIFGGEQYYADGGARDMISRTCDKQLAESIAKGLIGTKVPIVESWMDPEDWMDMTIEWTQVMDKEGTIHFEFGKPYGKGGHFEFQGLNRIKYIKEN
jgi:hypothetical protein